MILRSALVLCATLLAASAAAQEEPTATPPATPKDSSLEEIAAADTDPTKPVFFTLRDEVYDFRGPAWRNVFLLRADKLVLKDTTLPYRSKGLLVRADLPIVTHDDGQTTRTGLGDLYGQAFLVTRFKPTFALAYGSGLFLPTATDDSLGRGKFTVSPTIAPVWFFPRKGLAFVKIQDNVSFAGDSDRPDVHYLLVTPTLLWRLSARWWTVVDFESNTDWERDAATWYKAGFLLGRMLSPRSGFSLKVEVPFGDERPFDIIVKAVFLRTRF
jgi:hypothetical protein